MGGAEAEWSKALLVRENKRKIQKIPGSPPDLGTFLKKRWTIRVKARRHLLKRVKNQIVLFQIHPKQKKIKCTISNTLKTKKILSTGIQPPKQQWATILEAIAFRNQKFPDPLIR